MLSACKDLMTAWSKEKTDLITIIKRLQRTPPRLLPAASFSDWLQGWGDTTHLSQNLTVRGSEVQLCYVKTTLECMFDHDKGFPNINTLSYHTVILACLNMHYILNTAFGGLLYCFQKSKQISIFWLSDTQSWFEKVFFPTIDVSRDPNRGCTRAYRPTKDRCRVMYHFKS